MSNFWENKRNSDTAKKNSEQRYLEQSKNRLEKIVSTKMKTSFIGALAVFEKNFGYLWGHGIAEEDLTEEQLEMLELWEDIRTEVLNNGNTQLRAAKNEISNHVIKWKRYQTNFIVRGTEQNE